jgi:hypothetical protein
MVCENEVVGCFTVFLFYIAITFILVVVAFAIDLLYLVTTLCLANDDFVIGCHSRFILSHLPHDYEVGNFSP